MSRVTTKSSVKGGRIPTTVRLERPLHDELRRAVYEGRAKSFQEIAEVAFPLWLGLPPPTPPADDTLNMAGLSKDQQVLLSRYADALRHANGKTRPTLDLIEFAIGRVKPPERMPPHRLSVVADSAAPPLFRRRPPEAP